MALISLFEAAGVRTKRENKNGALGFALLAGMI
jgi:hypothetical protein